MKQLRVSGLHYHYFNISKHFITLLMKHNNGGKDQKNSKDPSVG